MTKFGYRWPVLFDCMAFPEDNCWSYSNTTGEPVVSESHGNTVLVAFIYFHNLIELPKPLLMHICYVRHLVHPLSLALSLSLSLSVRTCVA